jgi:hypothetical protein
VLTIAGQRRRPNAAMPYAGAKVAALQLVFAMPASGKIQIVMFSLMFAAAWVFFTPPGRRMLESGGVYTECAVEVWSLRKPCGSSKITEHEPTITTVPANEFASAGDRNNSQGVASSSANNAEASQSAPDQSLTVASQAKAILRAAPKHIQRYWAARHTHVE